MVVIEKGICCLCLFCSFSSFKDNPHPDEKERLELGERLGLELRQVKFWFQNRRTQMKVCSNCNSLFIEYMFVECICVPLCDLY